MICTSEKRGLASLTEECTVIRNCFRDGRRQVNNLTLLHSSGGLGFLFRRLDRFLGPSMGILQISHWTGAFAADNLRSKNIPHPFQNTILDILRNRHPDSLGPLAKRVRFSTRRQHPRRSVHKIRNVSILFYSPLSLGDVGVSPDEPLDDTHVHRHFCIDAAVVRERGAGLVSLGKVYEHH